MKTVKVLFFDANFLAKPDKLIKRGIYSVESVSLSGITAIESP